MGTNGKMGEALLSQVGGGAVGMGMNMLDEALNGQRRRDQQIEQQKKLTDIQTNANSELMSQSYGHQLQMWKDTNYQAQIDQMKIAGLNPAMIYGQGGGGGSTTGGGGASVGGSSASDESSRKMADIQQQGMGLQMQKIASEIDLNKAQAESVRSNAGLNTAKTETENSSRQSLIELATQNGIGKYLENIRENWKISGNMNDGLELRYDGSGKGIATSVNKDAFIGQEATNIILKSMEEQGNLQAQAALANKKAEGYFQELINATKTADANEIKAIATKLAAEWSTGEYTNWKTWVSLASDAVGAISKIISVVK